MAQQLDTRPPEAPATVHRLRSGPGTAAACHTLKVTLRGSRPEVWRLLQVPSRITLRGLADCLLAAMGWEGCHLHTFHVRGVTYWNAQYDDGDLPYENDADHLLSEILPRAGMKTMWCYDLGDCWYHDVEVVEVGTADGADLPSCLAGGGAALVEECGGIYGYASLVDALSDESHPRHSEAVEWLGADHDPQRFDFASAAAAVAAQAGRLSRLPAPSAAVGDAPAPAAPSGTRWEWLPRTGRLDVAGRAVAAGGFYVGSGDAGDGPDFVDPSLPVRWRPQPEDPDPERCDCWSGWGRWEPGEDLAAYSYRECSPHERGLLLEWLNVYLTRLTQPVGCGRYCNWRGSPTHFWAWYLRGVEHRLLVDTAGSWDSPDTLALLSELTAPTARLNDVTWFPHIEGQRFKLANYLAGRMHTDGIPVPAGLRCGLPHVPHGYPLLIDIGRAAAAGQPLDAGLAMRYVHLSSKTPAARAIFGLPEYDDLFRRLYRERCGDGLVVDTAGLADLVLEYQTLERAVPAQRHPLAGVPDVRASAAVLDCLLGVVTDTIDALKPYSRAVTGRDARRCTHTRAGRAVRDPEDGYDAAVISCLPAALFDRNPLTAELRSWIKGITADTSTGHVTLGGLAERCRLMTDTPTAREKAAVDETLRRLGAGCSPSLASLRPSAAPGTPLTLSTADAGLSQ